ncbi:endonuclease domain-containing protein, partial [Sphingomonas sp. Root1294]
MGSPAFKPRPSRFARHLRNNATDTEHKLWRHLRGSRPNGFKFSRQMPIAGFACDVLCRSARLVIELDGGQHDHQTAADEARTRRIEAEGYRVLRFWNNDVNERLEGVLVRITEALTNASDA